MTDKEFELYKERIIKIIELFLPNAKIYLFGSRARGDYTERSDYDIAIDNRERLPLVIKGQIRSMIDVLNIPQEVDVVDFNAIPDTLKNNILKEGIVWKS
jgi:predicted nucleotidyltransferase